MYAGSVILDASVWYAGFLACREHIANSQVPLERLKQTTGSSLQIEETQVRELLRYMCPLAPQ
jgi:hypothetical protein